VVLLGGMERTDAATGEVLGPCGVEAEASVRAAPDDGTVVVVLSVIFPSALAADLVPASLIKCGMAATRAGVGTVTAWRDDVLLARVGLEPSRPLGHQLFV